MSTRSIINFSEYSGRIIIYVLNYQVLYLYDNQIELIQNIGFATILQYLYLHNNLIKEIPNLPMPSLKKLYLDDNEVQTVSGLSACVHLEELHIARQGLPTYASLHFERDSLNAISRTLQTLEISGNGISLLAPFSGLYNLRKLYCQDNKVIDLAEVEMIVSLPRLEEANFKGNPCCTQFKYRDTAIGASSDAFQILDEIAVPKHQQVAIRGLMAHRRKIGAMSRFQRAINTESGSQMEFDEQQYEQQYEGQYGNQYDDAPYEPAQHAQQQQMYEQSQQQQQDEEYKGQEASEQNELDSFQQSTDNY